MNDFCGQLKVKRARLLHNAFLEYVQKTPVAVEVKRVLLLNELEQIFREEARLRRLSSKILANNTYLNEYARKLIHGGYDNNLVGKFRPSLESAPNAAQAIPAFEGLFCHRKKLGERMLEICLELYPGQYEWPLNFHGPAQDNSQVRKRMSGSMEDEP
jgi:hypothetical protein